MNRTVAAVFGAGLVSIGSLYAGEPIAPSEKVTFLQILSFGLEINVILGVLLFMAIFICFHLILTTRRRYTVPGDLYQKVMDDLANSDIEGAISRMQERDCLLAQTALPGLRLHHHTLERISSAMEGAGRRAVGAIKQEAAYLANIGTLSPMLGLLGTVLGLTKAFNVMGAEGPEGMRSTMMTASIGEAMGTTAVGLIVGIPAMAAYFLCLSRTGRIADDLESASENIAAALVEAASGRASASDATPDTADGVSDKEGDGNESATQ